MYVDQNEALLQYGGDYSMELLATGNAWCDSSWKAAGVVSPYSRLYYHIDGAGTLQTQDGTVTLKKGHIYLVPAGLPFSYSCKEYMRQLYAHVCLYSGNGTDALWGIGRVLEVDVGEGYIQQILEQYRKEDPLSCLYLRCVFQKDLLRLLYEHGSELNTRAYSKEIKMALSYIQEHLSAALTVRALAEALYMSPDTLAHKFRAEMGVPLGRYMDSLLMHRAEELLINTDMPLSSISMDLGFSDQFYFSRRFKEHFSVPPLKYRKSRRIER